MDISIEPWNQVVKSHSIFAMLESVFFEASATRSFADDATRAAFFDRWLGSYLVDDSQHSFLALTSSGALAGYVVGALDDPAGQARYRDLGYFRDFAPHTRLYPAHLHINVASQHRSSGIGARLVEAFLDHAAAHGAPGVHIVTGKGMRNVGFYHRCGFHEIAEAPWSGRTVVMMGRRLTARPTQSPAG